MKPRLVLLGGGHAHLFVLEGVAGGEFASAEVTLISSTRHQAYSGMLPGMVAGRYRPEDLSFDLEAITRRAGGRFIEARARHIRPGAAAVELADGRLVPFDVLSVATGSTARGAELPGVAEHAHLLKSFDRLLHLGSTLAEAARSGREPAVVVVGGGAAGVEVALAARAVLRPLPQPAAGSVTLLEQSSRLFAGRLPALERLALRALATNDVVFRPESEVVVVTADHVGLAGGGAVPAEIVIWAAGPASTSLLRSSGLPLDVNGFLLVDDHLRSPGDARIFAAGDAATPARWPLTPKAGVFAVREGPILRANLAATCLGARPRRGYRPRRRLLALLNTGDGRAVLSYGSWAAAGRWAMWLKDRIDRRFMRRFQRLAGTGAGGG